MIVGYTNGYYDMFHIGHLNLLQRASKMCDRLIVGVISDEECRRKKGVTPVIPLEQRLRIVSNIYRVGLAVPVYDDNKLIEWERYKYNILFVGSDHKDTATWQAWEQALRQKRVNVIYLPYTKETSSTLIKERIVEEAATKNQT